MYSPGPVLHDVTLTSGWPIPLASVANALSLPLPPGLQGTEELLESASQSLTNEKLSDRSTYSNLPMSHSTDSDSPASLLVTAIPFVLNAARQLRDLIQMNNLNSAYVRPTIPIWFSLIRTLAYICSEDLLTISETPYIRPRKAHSTSEDPILDGWASGLVSLVVENVTESQRNTTAMDTTSDGCSVNESGVVQLTDPPSTNSDTSTQRSLDVPFDAHILPGRGPRLYAVLPVLCIADESNICSLLTSALYQRHVWTIDIPIVGLVISRTGATAQVYLAWLEAGSNESNQLPTPHIAVATPCTSSGCRPSLGLFDLSDPISGLLFAQFMLTFGHQVGNIKKASNPPRIRPLFWRSDSIDDNRTPKEGQWSDRIVNWVLDVATASRNVPTTPPLPTATSSMDPKKKSRASAPASNADSTPSSNNPKPKSNKAHSNSSLAEGSQYLLDDPRTSFISWEVERAIIPIGRVRFDENSNWKHLNEFVDIYTKMLEPGWMSQLDLHENLHVNPLVGQQLSILHAEHKELKKDQANFFMTLDDQLVPIIINHLDIALGATLGIAVHKACEPHRTVLEAEWRHEWDTLQYAFYTTKEETVSTQVLLERKIHLSQNSALALGTDAMQRYLAWAQHREEYYLAAYGTVSTLAKYSKNTMEKVRASKLRKHYDAGFTEAKDLLRQVEDCLEKHSSPLAFAQFLQGHSDKEPVTAKCDSFLCVPIENFLAKDTTSKDHGLIYHTDTQASRIVDLSKAPTPKLADSGGVTKPSKAPTTSSIASDMLKIPADADAKTKKRRDSPSLANVIETCSDVSVLISSPPSSRNVPAVKVPRADALLLPVLLCEYKKVNDSEMKAVNQARSYLVSGVTFLKAQGVTECPVFGLVTNGPKGGVLMAWASTKDEKIYIIERDIFTFDISSPMGALQFSIFLVRLRQYNSVIREAFDNRKPAQLSNGWKKEPKEEAKEPKKETKEPKKGVKEKKAP